MKKTPLIRKSSGELEPYSSEKLGRSLKRSGANKEAVSAILNEIEKWIMNETEVPSRKIYKLAFSLLKKRRVGPAARYKLKKAMMEMGPTGHPFESFVGEIFRLRGYNVEVAQVLRGHCVTHEVDVIATKGNHQIFMECKFYQTTGKNANVQVPLYIKSRVDDIIRFRKDDPRFKGYTFSGGVVTNTRFTEDAENYGTCSGLMLLGWDFPPKESLRELIDQERVFPITTLTSLSYSEKQQLMDKGIVICRQVSYEPSILETIGVTGQKKAKVLEEVRELAENGDLSSFD